MLRRLSWCTRTSLISQMGSKPKLTNSSTRLIFQSSCPIFTTQRGTWLISSDSWWKARTSRRSIRWPSTSEAAWIESNSGMIRVNLKTRTTEIKSTTSTARYSTNCSLFQVTAIRSKLILIWTWWISLANLTSALWSSSHLILIASIQTLSLSEQKSFLPSRSNSSKQSTLWMRSSARCPRSPKRSRSIFSLEGIYHYHNQVRSRPGIPIKCLVAITTSSLSKNLASTSID